MPRGIIPKTEKSEPESGAAESKAPGKKHVLNPDAPDFTPHPSSLGLLVPLVSLVFPSPLTPPDDADAAVGDGVENWEDWVRNRRKWCKERKEKEEEYDGKRIPTVHRNLHWACRHGDIEEA